MSYGLVGFLIFLESTHLQLLVARFHLGAAVLDLVEQ